MRWIYRVRKVNGVWWVERRLKFGLLAILFPFRMFYDLDQAFRWRDDADRYLKLKTELRLLGLFN